MSPYRIVPAVLAALLLGGCAAMSEQECRHANWYEQGIRDAQAGKSRAHLQDLQEACAQAGVTPNAAQYHEGWSRGIGEFCTPENGARWGREGRSYYNTCPPQIEAGFLARYRDGSRVWEAEKTLNRLRSEQDSRQRDLDKAKDDKQRKHLREQLRDLDRKIRHARDDLGRAERNFHYNRY